MVQARVKIVVDQMLNISLSVKCAHTTTKLSTWERHLFTRAIEHDANYRKGKQTSFMFKHQANTHNGEEANFKAKVTSCHNDCLTRQVSEGVNISGGP
jgi:hypothetical protein